MSKKKCVSVVVVPNDPKVIFHIPLISLFHTYVSPISVCTMKFTGTLLSSEIWEEINVSRFLAVDSSWWYCVVDVVGFIY